MNQEQNYTFCKKCKTDFVYFPQEVYFDDNGYGYSTKLVKCPYCGQINVVKYYEDKSFDVNTDIRFYK